MNAWAEGSRSGSGVGEGGRAAEVRVEATARPIGAMNKADRRPMGAIWLCCCSIWVLGEGDGPSVAPIDWRCCALGVANRRGAVPALPETTGDDEKRI